MILFLLFHFSGCSNSETATEMEDVDSGSSEILYLTSENPVFSASGKIQIMVKGNSSACEELSIETPQGEYIGRLWNNMLYVYTLEPGQYKITQTSEHCTWTAEISNIDYIPNNNDDNNDDSQTDNDTDFGQGCCSSHGGAVSCRDGRVVCADGSLSPSCKCE